MDPWTCMDSGGAVNPALVQGQLGVCHSYRHGPPAHVLTFQLNTMFNSISHKAAY